MIVVKTPLRISLFGGGTDYPGWFSENGGVVVGGTIDKFVTVTARFLPPFDPAVKSRIVWKEVRTVTDNDAIDHPLIRAAIRRFSLRDKGLEIHHLSDLPARSGTGSSSAFAVGLVRALSALQGRHPCPDTVFREAVSLERDDLGETVGCQDQAWAALGGPVARIDFHPGTGGVRKSVLPLTEAALRSFESRLKLWWTGGRPSGVTASAVSKGYVSRLENDRPMQWAMIRLAEEGASAVARGDWGTVGELLERAWAIKRNLPGMLGEGGRIEEIRQEARIAGAIGGKLLGAGGDGGCLLFVVSPEKDERVREVLSRKEGFVEIPFRFEESGSRVVHCS